MVLICIKQHLGNIWSSIHQRIEEHWRCVKKSVAYRNKRVTESFSFRNFMSVNVRHKKASFFSKNY